MLDPHTRKKDKKHLKPFMVNNSVIVFEKEKIIFDPEDKVIADQFGAYRVKSISSNGMPTYSEDDEHIVDAVNLALLAFEQKYGELLRKVVSSKSYFIKGFVGKEELEVKSRDIEVKKDKQSAVILNSNSNNIVSVIPMNNKKTKSIRAISRRSF